MGNKLKLPLRLAVFDTRCEAIIFTLSEIEKFWGDELKPMLSEGRGIEEIEKALFNLTGKTQEQIGKLNPFTLPPIDMDGLIIEIPDERVEHGNIRELQNKINIAEREVKSWDREDLEKSQQGTSAKGKRTE